MKVASTLQKTEAAEYYAQMVLIRRFEEACARHYMQGDIRGFLHLYIGEEAIAVGAMAALAPGDYVVSHYRDHGHALARGMDPNIVMAELFGKSTGSSGGKGGSMHLFDVSRGFMGGYAIVGGQLPIATGLGLAIKQQDGEGVVLCFFGDGAVNQGEFHEALNMASLWKLPVLFILENNLYGMGTHVDRTHAAGRDMYSMADAYKIPSAQIDGMDLATVREAVGEAVRRVRSGSGPVFLEAMAYRFRGHSMADPSAYRDQAEVDEWRVKDPIERFRKMALDLELITPDQIGSIDREAMDTVAAAVKFARESPDPEPGALYTNVYS